MQASNGYIYSNCPFEYPSEVFEKMQSANGLHVLMPEKSVAPWRV